LDPPLAAERAASAGRGRAPGLRPDRARRGGRPGHQQDGLAGPHRYAFGPRGGERPGGRRRRRPGGGQARGEAAAIGDRGMTEVTIMATKADKDEQAFQAAIDRERVACLQVQRLSFALWTIAAGVTGFATGGYCVYRIMKKR